MSSQFDEKRYPVEVKTLSPEQKTKRQFINDIDDILWEEAENGTPMLGGDAGSVRCMAIAEKPAALLPVCSEITLKQLKDVFERNGIIIEIIPIDSKNVIIINPAIILKRVRNNLQLARQVGWEVEKSIADNLQKASADGFADHCKQALMGFILGYPESAIVAYSKREELTSSRGVPGIITIDQVGRHMILNDTESLEVPEIAAVLRDLQAHLEAHPADVGLAGDFEFVGKEYIARLEKVRSIIKEISNKKERLAQIVECDRKFKDTIREKIKNIYKILYKTNSETVDFLLSFKNEGVFTPTGNTAYNFLVSEQPPYHGSEAPDVQAIHQKVAQAFTDISH